MLGRHHPNFPPCLAIAPNVDAALGTDDKDAFGVEAQREAISKYGIAGRVWEAAYAMCAYVDPAGTLDFDPPFAVDAPPALGVLELGSGTGVVAARIGSAVRRTRSGGFVIATDLPDVCPLLRHNLSESDVVHVRSLVWGVVDHVSTIMRDFGASRLTHVVCSDLVYFPELFGPLLRTLLCLTSPSCAPSAQIILSYKVRSLSKETPFWSAFGLWFSFRPVLARRIRPVENGEVSDEPGLWERFGVNASADRTFCFVARRRPESMAWCVPESDDELMEGVDARGTWTRKSDDTFETILLMAMGDGDAGE